MGTQRGKYKKAVFASKSQVDSFMLPALDMSVMLLYPPPGTSQCKRRKALKSTTTLKSETVQEREFPQEPHSTIHPLPEAPTPPWYALLSLSGNVRPSSTPKWSTHLQHRQHHQHQNNLHQHNVYIIFFFSIYVFICINILLVNMKINWIRNP